MKKREGHLILDTTLVVSLPFALVACMSSLLERWGSNLIGGYLTYFVLRMEERGLRSSEGGNILLSKFGYKSLRERIKRTMGGV